MTIKEFVESAIEGGWDFYENVEEFHSMLRDYDLLEFLDLPAMVLDPNVWKAVGKSKGWKENFTSQDEEWKTLTFTQMEERHPLFQMRKMIEALYEGKGLEEYIESL